MTSSFTNLTDSKFHPINLLEEIIISKNWVFERPIEDEIFIEVPTKYSNLIIQVTWLKNRGRIEIRSFFYNKMDFSNNVEIYKLLNLINNKIDYGHFVINENKYPTFKNSIIVKNSRKKDASKWSHETHYSNNTRYSRYPDMMSRVPKFV